MNMYLTVNKKKIVFVYFSCRWTWATRPFLQIFDVHIMIQLWLHWLSFDDEKSYYTNSLKCYVTWSWTWNVAYS